jgi:hypothetical protein
VTQKVLQSEMLRFNEALREVMQVSKADLNRLLDKEKANAQPRKAGRKSSSSASSPTSRDREVGSRSLRLASQFSIGEAASSDLRQG